MQIPCSSCQIIQDAQTMLVSQLQCYDQPAVGEHFGVTAGADLDPSL